MDSKKKRQRIKDDSDDMDEDEDIYFEDVNKAAMNDESNDVDMAGEVNIEFLFSELRDTYFHNLKTLIKPLFELDNINISEIADLVLQQKEIGTVIKTELEEDTGNENVDLLALTTLVNFSHYKDNSIVKQITAYFFDKIEKYATDTSQKQLANNILTNHRVGLLLNERAVNLPMQLVPHLLKLLIDDIASYKEDNLNDTKFDVDYIAIICKYVKNQEIPAKKVKKGRVENINNTNQVGKVLHYKYEDEYFYQKAEVNFSWKIPFEEKFLDYQENSSEPQYFNILFVKSENFLETVKMLLDTNN